MILFRIIYALWLTQSTCLTVSALGAIRGIS
jgi:hypothetical protein